MNIALIGMPGSGKTTVGKRLAKALGYSFFDVDRETEARVGMRLGQILTDEGDEGFIHIEEEVITGLAKAESTVIATGGSVIYSERAMAQLGLISKIIFLSTPASDIKRRIRLDSRGIVWKGARGMDDLYRKRDVLYRKYANIVIDTKGIRPAAIVEVALRELGIAKVELTRS